MISAIDQGHIGALMLLDLPAAFDTVDHQILADVLRRRFRIAGGALDWMVNFLSDRNQVVRVGSCESGIITLMFGVPHGSVLGPKNSLRSRSTPGMYVLSSKGCSTICLLTTCKA